MDSLISITWARLKYCTRFRQGNFSFSRLKEMAYTKQQLVDYLYEVANSYGIDPQIAFKQINQESGFNPNARSPAGAAGIAQFIPETAKRFGLNDPYDPIASLNAWGAYMSELLNQFGYRYDIALAAYNSGENREEYRKAFEQERAINWSVLPQRVQTETRNYVRVILGQSDMAFYTGSENAEIGSPAAENPENDQLTIYSYEEADKPDKKYILSAIVIGGISLLLLALVLGGSSQRN
jgi:hypothetical protein